MPNPKMGKTDHNQPEKKETGAKKICALNLQMSLSEARNVALCKLFGPFGGIP